MTSVALYLHGDVFRPDSLRTMTKYIEKDLLTKERAPSACGRQGWSKHVSQGSLQWNPCAQAERWAEAGSPPQYRPAEAGGRNQAVPLKPHQLPPRKLRGLQTSRAAQFGGASSCTQKSVPGICPTSGQYGLQVGYCVLKKGACT